MLSSIHVVIYFYKQCSVSTEYYVKVWYVSIVKVDQQLEEKEKC